MSKNLQDELDDDTDSDDQDYVPEGDAASADESIHDSNEEDSGDENIGSSLKSTKRKHKSDDEADENENENAVVDEKTVVKQKERTEELWSKFLSDVKPSSNINKNNQQTTVKTDQSFKKAIETVKTNDTSKKSIFSDIVEASKPTLIVETAKESAPPPKPSKPAGLAGILDKISKKPKINTLEKSRQDWSQFKEAEKIEDELTSHAKGKSSYLERKAFLERTDYRQFELEKRAQR